MMDKKILSGNKYLTKKQLRYQTNQIRFAMAAHTFINSSNIYAIYNSNTIKKKSSHKTYIWLQKLCM